MSHDPTAVSNYLISLENDYLLKKYFYYFIEFKKTECKHKKLPASFIEHEPFYMSYSVLKDAINQIKMDINIMHIRRGDLIGDMRMSEGKIAGAIIYRLAKAHIINIHRQCDVCAEKCFSSVNTLIALFIGLDYINKNAESLPANIWNELIYTIKNRHVNQETLGLVLDALKELP